MKPHILPEKTQGELTLIAILFIGGIIFTCLLFIVVDLNALKPVEDEQSQPVSGNSIPEMVLVRQQTSSLVKPIIMADLNTESEQLMGLKERISMLVASHLQKGHITSISVYVRRLDNGNWISINGNETFLPGSLMKVPIMLYFLKQEELHPRTLDRKILCKKPSREFPKQVYQERSVTPDQYYSIREYLEYMIVDSDNLATHILCNQLDPEAYHAMFAELGIPPNDINDMEYVINPREFSKFLMVLYDGGYVNSTLSSFGMDLLTRSKFREGLLRGLPTNIQVAHKFGERGINTRMDFSESGLVYNQNQPYIITVMTRGTNVHEQTEAVSELSCEVFEAMKNSH